MSLETQRQKTGCWRGENRTEGAAAMRKQLPCPVARTPDGRERGLGFFSHVHGLCIWTGHPHVGVFCSSCDLSLLFIKAWDFLPRKSRDSMKHYISLCLCKTDPKAFLSLSILPIFRGQDALTAGCAGRGACCPFYARHVAGAEHGITHTCSSPGPLA